jgi:hypothetical protein
MCVRNLIHVQFVYFVGSDHAVVADGYGVDAATGLGFWQVRNSWGGFWGEAGYIRLFRVTDGTAELCGTDTTPGDGDGCPDGPASIQVGFHPSRPLLQYLVFTRYVSTHSWSLSFWHQQVCGECGVLSDSSYPYGGRLV